MGLVRIEPPAGMSKEDHAVAALRRRRVGLSGRDGPDDVDDDARPAQQRRGHGRGAGRGPQWAADRGEKMVEVTFRVKDVNPFARRAKDAITYHEEVESMPESTLRLMILDTYG